MLGALLLPHCTNADAQRPTLVVKGKENTVFVPFGVHNHQGQSLHDKSKTDFCAANQRGNILSPGKGFVLCFHLQQCQEYSKDKWESCVIIMFLFIYT